MPSTDAWVVTGNFTDDGAVSWRRADGTWARTLTEAGVVDEATATAQAAHAKAAEQREICDAYGIAVLVEAGVIDPLTARERIRANGPTVRLRRPDRGTSER